MNKYLLTTLFFLNVSPCLAQIAPDSTLDNGTVVSPNGDLINISGGEAAGTNLFHSFSQFSVNAGETAVFESVGIDNILGRVTGSDVSIINGTLSTDGSSANLFLINPNGMIFGENASLDLDGSFSAGTAESINFADGNKYSANPASGEILSVEIPLGVQLGDSSQSVTVEGQGSGIFFDDNFETDISERNIGLENSSISITGRNIDFDGGNISAPDGNIFLAAADRGIVNFQAGTALSDLEISDNIISVNEGSILTNGDGAGTIEILSGNLLLANGGTVLAQNAGEGSPGLIDIQATGLVEVFGESEFVILPTYLSTDNLFGSTDDGGVINIKAEEVLAIAGGQISASSFSVGEGGTINIEADFVTSESGGSLTSSALLVDAVDRGNGGILNINSDIISVVNGGQIGSTTIGEGTGGTINLFANEINVSDREEFEEQVFPSEIISNSIGEGTGGTINIITDDLNVLDGGQISATTFGAGDAGVINVSAANINIRNTRPNSTGFDPGIYANSGLDSDDESDIGKGGEIFIDAGKIDLGDGSVVTTNTFSDSDAGSIDIKAGLIDFTTDPVADTDIKSGIISSIARRGGDGGEILIDADEINIRSSGQINTATTDSGTAGDISINVGEIEISGFTEAGSSGLISTAVIGNGSGGNIDLNADRVNLADGGIITASNFSTRNQEIAPGQGSAGNITIEASSLEINDSDNVSTSINATSLAKDGGNINLSSDNLRLNGLGASVSAESMGAGRGGEININAENLEVINRAAVTSSATGTGDAGRIAIDADRIINNGAIAAKSEISGGGNIEFSSDSIFLNSGSISTSVADSFGGGGDININNQSFIFGRGANIEATALFGAGGNINIDSPILFLDNGSRIDASSKFGLNGSVTIDNPENQKELVGKILIERVVDPTGLIVATCPIANENSFSYIGNGGIASSPSSNISVSKVWHDVRIGSDFIEVVNKGKKELEIMPESISLDPNRFMKNDCV